MVRARGDAGVPALRPHRAPPRYPHPVFSIAGMTCSHCVMSVREEVCAVPGVTAVNSLLHVPGTPAPNKADALAATARRRPGANAKVREVIAASDDL